MGRFQNRYQESESHSFASYMNWEAADVTEKQMFTPPKSGRMMIDIVPYVIATKNHPLVAKSRNMKVGDLDYMLDIYVHRNVGPNRASVVCLRNFNKTCPICEFRKERIKIGGKDDEQAEALKGKRRVIYNILDATSDSMKIKIFEVAHYSFEKELLDEAKAEGERLGLAYLDYADPDEGYTIKCRTSEDDTGPYTFIRFKNFSFVQREKGIITPKLIKQAYSLDKYMNVLSAEEIEALLYSPDEEGYSPEADAGTGEEEAPRRRKASSVDTEDEDDTPPTRKRHTSTSEDTEEDAPSRRRSHETESDDEDEQPARRSRKREDDDDEDETAPRSRKAREEEDEEETPRKTRKRPPDEEDDDPPKRSSKKDKDDDCPHDHRFGVDTDKFEECDECKIWDQCAAELKKNKRKNK